jgi:hypothetical protein
MKKLITLFFSVVTIAMASSAGQSANASDVVISSAASPEQDRQAEIDKVNRQYDAVIASVRKAPSLSQAKKDEAIRKAEAERARKIDEINRRYGNTSGSGTSGGYPTTSGGGTTTTNDDVEVKEKYKMKKKGNNGKHLGWEKGVGNPHKNGGKPGKNKKG